MAPPKELTLAEIRQYMLTNGCRVTNHALVKHFKKFLTNPETQSEARKQFKTYVNILATIKNENNEKFLILRQKYINECPTEEMGQRACAAAGSAPSSPGGISITSEMGLPSPSPTTRQPPPYKPPPEVNAIASPKAAPVTTGVTVNKEHVEGYRECVNEFAQAMSRIDPGRLARQQSTEKDREEGEEKRVKSVSRANSLDDQSNKENIPRFSFSSGASGLSNGSSSTDSGAGEKVANSEANGNGSGGGGGGNDADADNPISVKEATRKFNRMASEEEAKVISPSAKKKPEKFIDEKEVPEVTLAHPKAKEWIVTMAKANYQELAKLLSDHPELVKLQDPATGYTALHWAAKHGNENVVKLVAGTYKADVNARTNGGYTPLHLAMQFGRVNIFELLCNVYKANRDLMDWSGNKPLDYSKQRTTVSASTYSKIKAKRKPTEKDLGFLRIGSLNVRVKKTTEAFSNFLGVGNGNGHGNGHGHANTMPAAMGGMVGYSEAASRSHQRSHRHHHHGHHHHRLHGGTMRNLHQHQRHPIATTAAMTMTTPLGINNRASVPISSSQFDKLHKPWGSVDNIPHTDADAEAAQTALMPPPLPKCGGADGVGVKKRQKGSKRSSVTSSNATDSPRDSISSSNSSSNLNSGYSSMPTTPNQPRTAIGLGGGVNALGDSDSDSACGFGSDWSVNGRGSQSSNNLQKFQFS